MNAIAQAAALLAGLIHIVIFCLESVLFSRPSVQAIFGVAPKDVHGVRPWAFNQGFYNLFLALGSLAGLLLLRTGDVTAGRALVALACGSMLAAAVVLLATNRRLLVAATVQGLAPLVALGLTLA